MRNKKLCTKKRKRKEGKKRQRLRKEAFNMKSWVKSVAKNAFWSETWLSFKKINANKKARSSSLTRALSFLFLFCVTDSFSFSLTKRKKNHLVLAIPTRRTNQTRYLLMGPCELVHWRKLTRATPSVYRRLHSKKKKTNDNSYPRRSSFNSEMAV